MPAAATIKSVDIHISQDDLKMLKESKYNLCFAKKVNDTYNVVWQSANNYLANNRFSWQPSYEIFGSNEFQGDVTVGASTNEVPIGLGQKAVLDADGNLADAVSGGNPTGLTLVNNYGTIHPSLSAVSTDIHGVTKTTPIYVAEQPIVSGEDLLVPVDCVQVWFEQNVQTSTMFSTARSNCVEIDLTGKSNASRQYSGGAWTTLVKDETAGVQPMTIVVVVATLTAAVVIQDLASKITSKLTGVYKDVKVDVTGIAGTTVKIEYKETKGLSDARLQNTQLMLANKTTVDQLARFAVEAFAQLGVGYVQMSANEG